MVEIFWVDFWDAVFFLGGLGWFLGDGVEVDVVQGSVFGEAA